MSISDNFPNPRAHKAVKQLQSSIALTPNFPWSQTTLLCGRLGQIPKLLRKSSPTLSIYVHRRESEDRLGRFETRSPQFPRSTELSVLSRVFLSPSCPGDLSQSNPLSRRGLLSGRGHSNLRYSIDYIRTSPYNGDRVSTEMQPIMDITHSCFYRYIF